MVKPPKTIWLQVDDVDGWHPETTWCSDKINDGDIEYVRAKKAEADNQKAYDEGYETALQ